MNAILAGVISKPCFVYIDNFVVYYRDVNTHIHNLQQAFFLFETARLTLNLKKCSLAQQSLSFLGDVISEEGIRTEHSKVKAIEADSFARNIKESQSWYHRCIKHFSEHAAPSHILKKKGVQWTWTTGYQAVFEDLNQALQSSLVLISPDFSKPFKV